MTATPQSSIRRNVVLVLLMSTLGSWGCGSAKYENRLAATSTWFRYKEKVDSHLQGVFHDEATGIQIRPPRGFELIPAPTPVPGLDGELTLPELDDRQPPFFYEQLPGMIAAWRSGVTAGAGEVSQATTAYMYVLSSMGPGASGDSGFRTEILDLLNRELGTDLSNGSLHEASYPANSQIGYVPQVAYYERSFVPERLIEDLSTEFAVYFHESSNEVVCVLFIYPQKVAGLNDLKDKIEFSLQTLAVKAASGNDGGGEPSPDGAPAQPARTGGM